MNAQIQSELKAIKEIAVLVVVEALRNFRKRLQSIAGTTGTGVQAVSQHRDRQLEDSRGMVEVTSVPTTKRIPAIKAIRNNTHLSLIESRDFVDAIALGGATRMVTRSLDEAISLANALNCVGVHARVL